MTDEKKMCAKMVYDGSGWHRYPCSKSAKYHEDGKDWCGTHLPSRVKAKQAASAAKWKARWAAKQAAREHEAALTAAREAVIQAAKGIVASFNSGDLSGAIQELLLATNALLRLETNNGGD